jgi:hypothetical protein
LFSELAEAFAIETSVSRLSRYQQILRLISTQAERVDDPDPVVFAACWLVGREDWMENNLELNKSIKDAIFILRTSDSDQIMQERVANILEQSIHSHRHGTERQIIIAQALGKLY